MTDEDRNKGFLALRGLIHEWKALVLKGTSESFEAIRDRGDRVSAFVKSLESEAYSPKA